MQPARRVDDQHVGLPSERGFHGVEDDGLRVGSRRLPDDVDSDPRAPRLQLLDGRGTKRVCGGEQDLSAVGLQRGAELGGGRRFARAVDAEHEDDTRPCVESQRLSGRFQRVDEKAAEQRTQLRRARDRPEHHLFTRAVREVRRDRRAEVGGDQKLFQLLVERIVDGTVVLEHGGEAGGEVLLRALQPVAQTLLQSGKQRHRALSVACRLAEKRWGARRSAHAVVTGAAERSG